MMRTDIDSFTLVANSKVRDALAALDTHGNRILFIINNEIDRNVLGVVTDGDMRRAALSGAQCDFLINDYINKDFKFIEETTIETSELLLSQVECLPVLNKERQLVGVLCRAGSSLIPVSRPSLKGRELDYLADCVNSHWISSKGEYVKKFEKTFSEILCIEHAISCSNGTSALHLALEALEISSGDEVILPDLTFGACANAIIQTGAKPVFVDVDPYHWTICPVAIQQACTRATKAIMVVHLYGHPCDMDSIMEIAEQRGLYVIEDCAESVGARYKDKPTGVMGDVGCFSFFSNKVITTGEGGMCVTSNKIIADRIRVLRDHGMRSDHRYWHEVPGFNYRMTNLQAALGVAQLEQLDQFLGRREKIAEKYSDLLRSIEGLILPPAMEWATPVNWLYSVLVDEEHFGLSRDSLSRGLNQFGIETRKLFYPLSSLPAFEPYRTRANPTTRQVSMTGLSLPTSNDMSDEEVYRVVESIRFLHEFEKKL